MSRINDLVAEHVPDGVRYVELASVAGYSDTRVDATSLDGTTFVGVDNLLSNKAGRVDANYAPNTSRLTAYEPGDILLGNIRPYLKKVWLATNSGGCSGDVLAVRINKTARASLVPEFLYYILASDRFFAYNMTHAKGAKMPRGSKEAILKYRIPVPPVEMQLEIVRTIDSFSALKEGLEAELAAELEARQIQHAHYRGTLLSFSGQTKSVTLSDICRITRGRVISKDYLREHAGTYPVYSSQTANSGVFGFIDTFEYDFESITWTTDGANAGSVFYHRDEEFSITNVCGLLRVLDDKTISTKFLYFVLGQVAKQHVSAGMGNPKLMANAMSRVQVPVPPLAEQERIVSILDNFDALADALRDGLAAELGDRRNQYEYYCDRLLTFEEMTA